MKEPYEIYDLAKNNPRAFSKNKKYYESILTTDYYWGYRYAIDILQKRLEAGCLEYNIVKVFSTIPKMEYYDMLNNKEKNSFHYKFI